MRRKRSARQQGVRSKVGRAKHGAARAKAQEHRLTVTYRTSLGKMLNGTVEEFIASRRNASYAGKVQLIFTSPPFPLNRKKRYGNRNGLEYREWLADLAPRLASLLTPDGSIVIELGNAWEPGRPVMSVLATRALLDFLESGNLRLCQQFVCNNPTRLPSPAQWVNIERIRVKDSFTHLWWMARCDRPKADNRRVLKEYSASMQTLLRTGKYNGGERPSQHRIGKTSFLSNNGGSIAANCLSFTNTTSAEPYLQNCRQLGVKPHPARMPSGLAEFFIRFLTEENDLVLDPFAGSNTTGAAAERLNRRWLSLEPNEDFIQSSVARFPQLRLVGR